MTAAIVRTERDYIVEGDFLLEERWQGERGSRFGQ